MAVNVTAEEKIRIATLWAHQLTSASIGAEIGMSAERVRKVAQELGLAPHKKPRAKVCDDELRRRWEAGESRLLIADDLGVSPAWIDKRVRLLNLPRRTTGGDRSPFLKAKAASAREKTEAAQDEAVVRVPEMPAHPFWTPERDLLVLRAVGSEADGTYAAVNTVAAALGKPAAAVLQRLHRLRAAS